MKCEILEQSRERIIHRALSIIWLEPSASELISASAMIGWALVLATGAREPGWLVEYGSMFDLVGQGVWALLFALTSIAQTVFLCIHHRRSRALVDLFAACLWLTVAGFTAMAEPLSPAPWVYAVIGVSNCWAYAQNQHRIA